MKKLLSILSAGLFALLAFSCVTEEFATFDETKATAPVIGSYELGEKALTIAYTPGAFNMGFNEKVPVNHSLILATVDGKPVNKAITASFKESEVSVTINNLAKALIALGYQEGNVVSLDMFIRASLQAPSQDNGRNGHVDSQGHVTISGFEVFIPVTQGNPWEAFTEKSEWSLIGSIASTGNGWNKDETVYKTPDGKQHVAKNIKLTPDDQFKFRKDGGWDVNRGAPGDVEPYVMKAGDDVEATQNGKNLGVAVEGNYDILYDEESETITITEAFQTYPGFDQKSEWSVIGKIASISGMEWNKDITMTTDGEWHVCEGVVLTKGDEFKFRMNQGWDTNIGAPGDTEPFVVTIDEEQTGVGNGKNLSVPEDGTYDLLCNPAAGLYKVVVSLGGHSPLVGEEGGDEPGPDEPGEPTVWSVIGSFGEDGWKTDFDMTKVSDGVWIIRKIEVNATDEFKIRADHGWDLNIGGSEANSKSTIDPSNVYDVFKPEIGTAFSVVDKDNYNIQIGVAGVYNVTYNTTDQTVLIEPYVAGYSLIGVINGTSWNADFMLTEDGGVYKSEPVKIAGGFKIRYNCSWDDADTYGVPAGFSPVVGEVFDLVQPGSDMVLPEGEYIVTFDKEDNKVLIEGVRADWYYHGQSELTPDWGELPFEKVSDEEYVLTIKTVSETSGFVLKNGDASMWIGPDASLAGEDGKYTVELGKEFKISSEKVDGVIVGEGEYKITFNPVAMTAVIKSTIADWYYHGQSELTPDWGPLPFEKVSDEEYVLNFKTISANSGFVLRNGDASSWIGPDASQQGEDGKFVVTIGEEFKISGDKVDGIIPLPGEYKLTFNPVAMTAIITSVRSDWYYHGQSELTPDWGELPLLKVSDTEYTLNLKTVSENSGFVLKNGDASKWIGPDASLKGDDGKYTVVVGEEFKISEDKVDGIIAAPGEYVLTFNPVAMTAVITSVARADWYYHGQSEQTPDWGELPFEKVSDEEYRLELTTVSENSGFVLKNGDASSWIGPEASQGVDGKFTVVIGEEFKISGDKVDGIIPTPGVYIFTFNPVTMTGVINSARADWYYHGQSKETPDWGETPFVKVSDKEYYVILDVNDNSGFVLKNGSASLWIGADASLKGEDGKYTVTPGLEFAISEDKVDGVIEKAGKYKLTFYPEEMKAVLTTAEPEYCYHGQSKRTPDWGTVPFEKVSDEEYYVILEVEAGYGFVLKTADESSWFGPAASQKGEDGKFHVVLGTEFSIDGDKVDGVFDAAGLVKMTYNPKTQKAVVIAL